MRQQQVYKAGPVNHCMAAHISWPLNSLVNQLQHASAAVSHIQCADVILLVTLSHYVYGFQRQALELHDVTWYCACP